MTKRSKKSKSSKRERKSRARASGDALPNQASNPIVSSPLVSDGVVNQGPAMPKSIELNVRAAELCNVEKYAEAEPICRQILEENPNDSYGLRLLGIVLRNTDRVEESIEPLQNAVRLMPEKPEFQFELGSSYKMMDRLQEALDCYLKCVDLRPDFWQANSNISSILEGFGRFQESLPWALRAAQLGSDHAVCHYNLGNAQMGLGHIDSARMSYDRAIEIEPDHAKAHWNLSLCHLLKGNFRDGWKEHDWRVKAGQVNIDNYPQPLWQGQPLEGKTILVHAEQGIGDETLFASCIPELIEQAGEVIVTCDPRLTKLFIRSFPEAMIYGVTRTKAYDAAGFREQVDYQTPAGGVPKFFRNEWSDFPGRLYLVADESKTAMWRERYDALGPGLKIGISWRTGGLPASRRTRVTSLPQWQHLFNMPGVQWINLQYGNVVEEIAAEHERSGTMIHDWDDGDPLVDLDGFSSRLSALDLVISVGNASAHLAGALGVESWVLLPRPATWRWLDQGEKIPWYSSVTALRQQTQGDWTPVLERLGLMLSQRLGIPAPSGTLVLPEIPQEDIDFLGPDGIPLAPDNIADYLEQAKVLTSEGQLEEAEEIYTLILKHFPRDYNTTQYMGSLALATGRSEMAIRYLLRALQITPENAIVNFNLANAYRMVRRHEEAIYHYRRAIALDPEMSDAHLNLGVTLGKVDRIDEARAAYQKALEIDPQLQAARKNLANLNQPPAGPHFPTNAGVTLDVPTPLGVPTMPVIPSQPT